MALNIPKSFSNCTQLLRFLSAYLHSWIIMQEFSFLVCQKSSSFFYFSRCTIFEYLSSWLPRKNEKMIRLSAASVVLNPITFLLFGRKCFGIQSFLDIFRNFFFCVKFLVINYATSFSALNIIEGSRPKICQFYATAAALICLWQRALKSPPMQI